MKAPRATDQGHQHIDQGNLAYHRVIADHLRTHPEAVEQALARIDRWERKRGRQAYFDTWRHLLTDLSIEELANAITADTEYGREIRQSTPFAGIIPESDRIRILRGDHEPR
jgi:hypothetical protein